MQEFSTVDGFVEVTECLAEMIKYVANEPSVGLFYIQQHVQNAIPNLVNLKNNVVEKSREMALHTEDTEDSISTIRSVRECGFPIADDMIREIRSSLAIVSSKHPKRGLISSSGSTFQMGRTRSWGPVGWGRNSSSSQQDCENTSSYFSNVVKSAKLKASILKWPQIETSKELVKAEDKTSSSYINRSLSEAHGSACSNMPDTEPIELPLSSQVAEGLHQGQVDGSMSREELLSLENNYEEFKANREAKLEEWLGETRDQCAN